MPSKPGLGWHPSSKNYVSEPIHAPEMSSGAWGTPLVTTSIYLAATNGLMQNRKCHTKLRLANDDLRQIADLKHTKKIFG